MTPEQLRLTLLAKFRTASEDRLAKLNADLMSLESDPDQSDVVERVMREIHTLKGESRMLALAPINQVAHRTEDLLVAARDLGFQIPRDHLRGIYRGLDLLAKLISTDLSALGPGHAEVGAAFDTAVKAFQAGDTVRWKDIDVAEASQATAETGAADTSEAHASKGDAEAQSKRRKEPARKGDQFISVSSRSVTELSDQASQFSLRQAQTKSLANDLVRLMRDSVRAGEVMQAGLTDLAEETGMADAVRSSLNTCKKLGALHKEMVDRVQRLSTEVFESELVSGSLQESVRAMRLLRITTLFNKYPSAIRDLADEQDKAIRILIEDNGVAIDKQVLEALEEPMLHLIRNSVDHGMEEPSERERAGKPEVGIIRLAARKSGESIEVRIEDDGRGIDPQRIRQTIVRRGLLDDESAAKLDCDELYQFLFASGFTTRKAVSDLSGRGVGLDVVRKTLESLGGSVRVVSEVGKGTTFHLRVPVSMALSDVLLVQLAEGLAAIPAENVVEVLKLDRSAVRRSEGGAFVELSNAGLTPFADLGNILGLQQLTRVDGDLLALHLRYQNQDVCLAIRSVRGQRRLVQLKRSPFISRATYTTGSALIEGGEVVLFLSVPTLFQRATRSGTALSEVPTVESSDAEPALKVLVVEDSELTRQMLTTTIANMGFTTLEATDGLDALQKLEKIVPDIILTDLDMPGLNGFGLLEKIRGDDRLCTIPSIVLSTRDSQEDKQRAVEAGANAYLVKGAFRESKLKRTFEYVLEGR